MSEDVSEVAWNKASLTSDGRESHSVSSDLSGISLKIQSYKEIISFLTL